jgi:hypothetical protein
MTGSDILAQVRHALGNSTEFEEWAVNNNVLAALDGCVLLTAAEAKALGQLLTSVEVGYQDRIDAALTILALLTPESPRDEADVLADAAQEKADRYLKREEL